MTALLFILALTALRFVPDWFTLGLSLVIVLINLLEQGYV